MGKEKKEKLVRIVISSALLLISIFVNKRYSCPKTVTVITYLIPYTVIALDSIKEVVENIFTKVNIFNEDFLMVIASIGAFVLKEYEEASLVFILYSIGELFEDTAIDKSKKSISDLMDLRPDYANILFENKLKKIDPKNVKPGDLVYVRPGEKIPFDGEIVDIAGMTQVKIDQASLTGESKARALKIKDKVISGSINISGSNREILNSQESDIINGTITIKVGKSFFDSTASKIMSLVESDEEGKAKSEKFITRFARIYTPIVCALALLISIIPGAIFHDFTTWVYRGLTFLVISCPCALVISIPLAFFSSIGGASKNGILIKGANIMENLSKVSIVAFDKTGTLTEGNLENDRIRITSKEAITTLKKIGIRYTIILTGDSKGVADEIGNTLGIDEVICELLPDGKVKEIERLLKEKKSNDIIAYVGDGINDVPCLLKADIGIAMGLKGSDASIKASDIVLMDNDPLKISKAIKIAEKCLRIVKENIAFSILIKCVCLIFSAFGVINMWLAIFSDVGVMILAVLNALRGIKE